MCKNLVQVILFVFHFLVYVDYCSVGMKFNDSRIHDNQISALFGGESLETNPAYGGRLDSNGGYILGVTFGKF